jgi:hypothetical protein
MLALVKELALMKNLLSDSSCVAREPHERLHERLGITRSYRTLRANALTLLSANTAPSVKQASKEAVAIGGVMRICEEVVMMPFAAGASVLVEAHNKDSLLDDTVQQVIQAIVDSDSSEIMRFASRLFEKSLADQQPNFAVIFVDCVFGLLNRQPPAPKQTRQRAASCLLAVTQLSPVLMSVFATNIVDLLGRSSNTPVVARPLVQTLASCTTVCGGKLNPESAIDALVAISESLSFDSVTRAKCIGTAASICNIWLALPVIVSCTRALAAEWYSSSTTKTLRLGWLNAHFGPSIQLTLRETAVTVI